MLLLAITLSSFVALVTTIIIKPQKRLDTLIILPVLVMTQIVLLTQILSELRLISARGYLAGHVLLSFIALIALALYRPTLQLPTIERRKLRNRLRRLGRNIRLNWISCLFAGVVALYLGSLVLNFWQTQASGWDASVYHFPRAVMWLQEGTARHFQTENFRMTEFPPNASYVYAWLIGLDGVETLTLKWPQLIGAVVTSLAIIGLAREAGAGMAAGVMAAGSYLLLPNTVERQYFYGNIDLIVTGLATGTVYFALSAIHTTSREQVISKATIVWVGLCGGLAVGTKLTALFLLAPAAGLLLFYIMAHLRQRSLRILLPLAVSSLLGVLVFGSYNYILNYTSFGNPISSRSVEDSSDVLNYSSYQFTPEELESFLDPTANLLRYLHQMADWSLGWRATDDLTTIQTEFDSLWTQLEAILDVPHIAVNMDSPEYGIVVFLAMVFGPVLGLIHVVRQRDILSSERWLPLLYAVLPWICLILFSVLLAHSYAKLRLYIIFVPYALLAFFILLRRYVRDLVLVPILIVAVLPVFSVEFDRLTTFRVQQSAWLQPLAEWDTLSIGFIGEREFAWNTMQWFPNATYTFLDTDVAIDTLGEFDFLSNIDRQDCTRIPPPSWHTSVLGIGSTSSTCWFTNLSLMRQLVSYDDGVWVVQSGPLLATYQDDFETVFLPEMIQSDSETLVLIEHDSNIRYEWIGNATCGGQSVTVNLGYRHFWFWFPDDVDIDPELAQRCVISFNRSVDTYQISGSRYFYPQQMRVYSDDDPLQAPVEAIRLDFQFGSVTLLEALYLPEFSAPQCGDLEIRSWWQPQSPTTDDYRVTFSLTDADGAGRAQSDGLLGSRPSVPTDQNGLLDWRAIDIPCDLEPGRYDLLVGLYEQATVSNLPISNRDGAPLGDLAYITTIEVTAGP